MNLAYRDIKHNLLRFVLTNFGLSLLLGIVIVITGVYGGLIDDALRQARAANADLWVVAGRHQRAVRRSIAHSGRHEGIGQPGLWRGARRLRHLPIGPDRAQRQAAPPLPHRLRAGPARRSAQTLGRARHHAQPLRNDRRPLRRPRARPGSAAGHARSQVHRRRPDAERAHVFRRSRGLHHLARRASAAVRARSSGRAARGRARRGVANQRSDQRRHCQGVALRARSRRSPPRSRDGSTSRRSPRSSRKPC